MIDGKTYAPIHDHSGHIVTLVDAADGVVSEVYRYSAFGEETCYKRHREEEWRQTFAPISPWRFSSKRTDHESGLVNFGRRYYDPESGRWLTPDPAGYDDGPNLYAYVHNSPLTHIDLYGLYSICPRCGGRLEGYSNERATRCCRNDRWTDGRCAWRKPRSFDFMTNWFEKIFPRSPASCNYCVPGKDSGKVSIGSTNGMKTTFDGAWQHTKNMSGLSAGYRIFGTFNSTMNSVVDFVECLLGRLCLPTDPVRKLHQKWTSLLQCHDRHLEVCTSQGCIHVRNALKALPVSVRDRISVLAIAPGAYIEKKLCHQVEHYYTENDFVAKSDPCGAYRCGGNVHVVPSHPAAPWFDHSISSPTFSKIIQGHIRQFVSTNGQEL